MSRIYKSKDSSFVMSEILEDMIAVNIINDEFFTGTMITRAEAEVLCFCLAEYCGIVINEVEEE